MPPRSCCVVGIIRTTRYSKVYLSLLAYSYVFCVPVQIQLSCLTLYVTNYYYYYYSRRRLCVFFRTQTKTAETTITKLATEIDSPSWVLAIRLILGQRVKYEGHRVTNCKKTFLASGRREFALYRVPRLLASCYYYCPPAQSRRCK